MLGWGEGKGILCDANKLALPKKKKKKKIYSSSNLVSSLKMQYAGKSEYFSPVFQFDKLFLFFVFGLWILKLLL